MKRFRLVSFSMVELVQRMTIWELRRTGNSPSYIIKSTGYRKTTVYRAMAKFDAEGKVERSRHSPQNDQK